MVQGKELSKNTNSFVISMVPIFNNQWIGTHGPVQSPPWSPDLTLSTFSVGIQNAICKKWDADVNTQ